jgi:hypothetical protein
MIITRQIPLGDALLADLKKHCSAGLLFPNPTTGMRIIQGNRNNAGRCNSATTYEKGARYDGTLGTVRTPDSSRVASHVLTTRL